VPVDIFSATYAIFSWHPSKDIRLISGDGLDSSDDLVGLCTEGVGE
jgi:hypothetical protein